MSYLGAPKYSKVEIQFREHASKKILNEVLNNKSETITTFVRLWYNDNGKSFISN